jgi:hypothetical protein
MLWNNEILKNYFNYILDIFSLFNSWHPTCIEVNYNYFFITLHIIYFLQFNWRQMEIISPKYKCIEVVSYLSNLWCKIFLIYNFSFIGILIKTKSNFFKEIEFHMKPHNTLQYVLEGKGHTCAFYNKKIHPSAIYNSKKLSNAIWILIRPPLINQLCVWVFAM